MLIQRRLCKMPYSGRCAARFGSMPQLDMFHFPPPEKEVAEPGDRAAYSGPLANSSVSLQTRTFAVIGADGYIIAGCNIALAGIVS